MLVGGQSFSRKRPSWLSPPTAIRQPASRLLQRIAYSDQINQCLASDGRFADFEFVDAIFDRFDFSYSVSSKDKSKIPSEGRVVIIANHPIGSLDSLALLRLVGEVRQDVKILAGDIVSRLPPLVNMVIADSDHQIQTTDDHADSAMLAALESESAVIVFPAREVSRARPTGIRDGNWAPLFLNVARRAQAPILPVRIAAKNSLLFYSASALFKPWGTALLPHEMFNKRSATIHFDIGELIPFSEFVTDKLRDKTLIQRLKKHVYKLGRKHRPIFHTLKTIAHPENPKQLQAELSGCEMLGETRDGNRIYLVNYDENPTIMRELGRLREIAFRRVGEGTGARRDLDQYDCHYRHLVLWDRERLAIAGAYRIGEGEKILQNQGVNGFYTHSLYQFDPKLHEYLAQSIELGRSFVNPDYWGKASLDYLWQGIGAYLRKYPARYMMGPVSMSADYPPELIAELVYFYRRYYSSAELLVIAHRPYDLPEILRERYDHRFGNANADDAFTLLQADFSEAGFKLPVLFKQYMSLFEEGGFTSLAFSVDPDFNDCLDGLCLADVTRLKKNKAKRYLLLSDQ